MIIKTAITDFEILSCWDAISQLRPALQKENLVDLIRKQQVEGYKLIFIEENNVAVSIAGYRIFSMLHSGKQLYIDDLSTIESVRGKGFGTTLLKYIYEIAKDNNCVSVNLDSGFARTVAHKLYFNEGFTVSSFHFTKNL